MVFLDEEGVLTCPPDSQDHGAAIKALPQHVRVAARQLQRWLAEAADSDADD